jgi:hypothetical protein
MSDVSLFVSEGWHLRCGRGPPADETEIEVDAYIESRIAGKRNQSFIDRQEAHVLLMLFHFLGWLGHNRLPTSASAVMRSPPWASVLRGSGSSEGGEMIERVVKGDRAS